MICACTVWHSTIERGAFAIGDRKVTACECQCHAPCLVCGETDGHIAECMANSSPAYLTPGERADLRTIAKRAEQDAGDNRPMLAVTYDEQSGQRIERVIPWQEAVNIDPASI